MAGIQDLLTEPQREAVARRGISSILATSLATAYLNKSEAESVIAETWAAAYQLDAAQQSNARVAARMYVEAVGRLEAQTRTSIASLFRDPGAASSYEYRVRVAREQRAALRLVEASMTSAQQDRFRRVPLREVFIFDEHVPLPDEATNR